MITGKFIFENVVTSNYLNKAGLKFFYFVDLKLLLTDPYKHLHSNSFLSIVLLDTFNDYFDFFGITMKVISFKIDLFILIIFYSKIFKGIHRNFS